MESTCATANVRETPVLRQIARLSLASSRFSACATYVLDRYGVTQTLAEQ